MHLDDDDLVADEVDEAFDEVPPVEGFGSSRSPVCLPPPGELIEFGRIRPNTLLGGDDFVTDHDAVCWRFGIDGGR